MSRRRSKAEIDLDRREMVVTGLILFGMCASVMSVLFSDLVQDEETLRFGLIIGWMTGIAGFLLLAAAATGRRN